MDYDVIIAGASFAGLAAANALVGKQVLLVDSKPIGAGQTSACGTLYGVIEALSLHDSLRQVHPNIILHTPHHDFTYRLAYPFCTFDYTDFCTLLSDRAGADFLRASVLGLDGDTIVTSRGDYHARCFIDASGWRAALSPEGSRAYEPQRGMSFGLETTLPHQAEGLHFWYDPERLLPFGVAWLFPVGPASRFGLGSYQGRTSLRADLTDWLFTDFNLLPAGFHGGYFPHTSQTPTAGQVLRAGDAAGQCLPLTGEGIRPALYFGLAAGRLVRRVLEDGLPLVEALSLYSGFVMEHRIYYDLLLTLQEWLTRPSLRLTEAAAGLVHWPFVLKPITQLYWQAFDPVALAPTVEEINAMKQRLPQQKQYRLAA
jgi:flavin-dependent dehydrogenase